MSPLVQIFATILSQHCALASAFPWKEGQELWAANIHGCVDGILLDEQHIVATTTPYECSAPVNLTAYSASSGQELWRYTYKESLTTDILTDSKGDLIFGSGKSLHKVSRSGEPLFTVPVPGLPEGLHPWKASIALDKDDNIYVVTPHGLLSLDSAGKPLGHLWHGNISDDAPTFGPNGIMLVHVRVPTSSTDWRNRTIYAKDLHAVKDGKTLWSFSLKGQMFNDSVIGLLPASVADVQVSDDLILVGTSLAANDYFRNGQRGPALFALDATGNIKWNFTVPHGRINTPVVSKGVIYTVAERFLPTPHGADFAYTNSYPLAISMDGRAQRTSGECSSYSALSPGANDEIFGVCFNMTESQYKGGYKAAQYNFSLRSMTQGGIQWETALASGHVSGPYYSPVIPSAKKPVVGQDGFVYCAVSHGEGADTDVYGVSVDGDRGWRKTLGLTDGLSRPSSFRVDPVKGIIYLIGGPCSTPWNPAGVHAVSQKAVQKTIVV